MEEPTLDGRGLVVAVICSLNGGYNGRNLERQLSITEQGDGSIRYALIDTTGTLDDQVFTVTITPVEG